MLPSWTLEDVVALSNEVQAVLQGPSCTTFCQMWETPDRWDAALQGTERLRCVNAMLTRLRFARWTA